MLNLSKKTAISQRSNPTRQRNICVVLGCIAEKLAAPRNMDILNNDTIEYLLTNLVSISRNNIMDLYFFVYVYKMYFFFSKIT